MNKENVTDKNITGAYEKKIQLIQEQVRKIAKEGLTSSMHKGDVSHTVPNPHQQSKTPTRVDISSLRDIHFIDPKQKVCRAEAAVPFRKLVEATLEYNLIPYTVPELKTITVGGAVSGCSLESMSYRYGGFHDSCLEYELIDGLGQRLTCTKDDEPFVFEMIHGAYGTLAVLTSVTMKLTDAKPFVHMIYEHFDDFREFNIALNKAMDEQNSDFIDGIIHNPTHFVLCLGRMTEKAPYLNTYDWLKVYYKSTLDLEEDYLTITDYFFRYDTECHWLTKTVPLLETFGVRLLFGKVFLGSSNLIKWSDRLAPVLKMKKRPDVVVDVFIPRSRFTDFWEWYAREYQFYPLWIVPYKAPHLYSWISEEYARGMDDLFFIDCAVYGKVNNNPLVDYSKVLEKKTIELNGIKTLISRNHFDRDEFWKIYHRTHYDKAKERLDPKSIFPNLYDKVHPPEPFL